MSFGIGLGTEIDGDMPTFDWIGDWKSFHASWVVYFSTYFICFHEH